MSADQVMKCVVLFYTKYIFIHRMWTIILPVKRRPRGSHRKSNKIEVCPSLVCFSFVAALFIHFLFALIRHPFMLRHDTYHCFIVAQNLFERQWSREYVEVNFRTMMPSREWISVILFRSVWSFCERADALFLCDESFTVGFALKTTSEAHYWVKVTRFVAIE